jgi:hypothetical protein
VVTFDSRKQRGRGGLQFTTKFDKKVQKVQKSIWHVFVGILATKRSTRNVFLGSERERTSKTKLRMAGGIVIQCKAIDILVLVFIGV